MLIIHSNRKGVTNFDNAKSINLDSKYIVARMIDETAIALAKYETDERAQEVFVDILDGITSKRIDIIPLPPE